MRKLAFTLAVTALVVLTAPATVHATVETPEAKEQASDAAANARQDMVEVFGDKDLKPGQYLWRDDGPTRGEAQVVVSLGDQMAYLYRNGELVAVSTISSGIEGRDTPTGIFQILQKKPLHHSKKYDNAPMPFMQRIDDYGVALHAGKLPGYAASHGCVRLPAKFAARLYQVTQLGSTVVIGA